MALNQIAVIDKIEIIAETGQIQIRQQNQIQDDAQNNLVIASNYERWVLNPGDDITKQTAQVQTIAKATWTPDIVKSYQEMLDSQKPPVINTPTGA